MSPNISERVCLEKARYRKTNITAIVSSDVSPLTDFLRIFFIAQTYFQILPHEQITPYHRKPSYISTALNEMHHIIQGGHFLTAPLQTLIFPKVFNMKFVEFLV